MPRRLRKASASGVAVVLLCAGACLAAAASPAATTASPRVMLIGDSVATGMLWHADAVSVIQRGLNFDWEVAVCRRLTGVSCTFEGVTPPNLVDLVSSLDAVPPIVVVEMGYNDFEATFAASVDQAIDALLQHGAEHILWLDLREVHHPYIHMNDILAAAAARYPEVDVVQWNRYARSHLDWFQVDGEHLVPAGGVAMAGLIHLAIDKITAPLKILSAHVAPAQVGRDYSVQLAAAGGVRPYRWQLSGQPPRGLHLLARGRLYGTPEQSQRTQVTLRVSDAEGQTTARRVVLQVR